MKGECCLPEILNDPKAGFAETESVIRTGRPADSIRARGVVTTPTRCRIYGCSSSFTPNSVSLLHRGADHIWVVSFPYALRFLFATRPAVMGEVLGIVYRVIAGHLVKKAGETQTSARTGAVTLIQRFGSALTESPGAILNSRRLAPKR